MKKIITILVVLAVVVVGLAVIKDIAIGSLIGAAAGKVLGAPVRLSSFSLGLLRQTVKIEGFKIYNPKGFPAGVLVDIAKVEVDYDLPAIFKGTLHLKKVYFNLNEVNIVKNEEGVLNVDSLAVVEQNKQASGKQEAPPEPAKQLAMQIDEVTLTIGKVIYTDYSAAGGPSIQTFDVGVKEKTYKNITSAQQLSLLVLSEAMKGTAIRGAAIYGAATVLGVAFLPAGVVGVLTDKDYSQQSFTTSFDKAYQVSLDVLKGMGRVTKEDKNAGTIKGNAEKNDVTIKIEKESPKIIKVTVSARKFFLPQSQFAGGVLYRIAEKLK